MATQDLTALMSMTPSEIEHAGVKGMKWGVRKARKPGTSRIAREIQSTKREISTAKDLMNVSKMSEDTLRKKVNRQRNENELKKLTNKGILLKTRLKNRDEYLNRAKLSDPELAKRVQRLQLESQLKKQVLTSNASSIQLAKKIISESSKAALTAVEKSNSISDPIASVLVRETLRAAMDKTSSKN